MSDINRLVVAWVSAQQRHYRQSTRGILIVAMVWAGNLDH